MRYLLPLLALLSLLLVATPAWATISDITITASGDNPFSTTSSWTHTPVGGGADPEGVVVVIVANNETSDNCTTVTYGGLSLSDVTLSPSTYNTASEDSTIHIFFLGVDVTTRSTDTIAVTCTGINKTAWSFTFEATEGDMTEVTTNTIKVLTQDPSGTLSLGGVTSVCIEGAFSGFSNIDPPSGWSPNGTYEYDYASQGTAVYKYDTIASSDVTFGFTQGAEDNHAFGACFREPAAAATGDLLGIDFAGGVSKQ